MDRDRQWLDDLAHATGGDLLRFLHARLSSTHDAEDLAQEVYLRLLRVKNTSEIQNRRAYVLRVAANVIYEWRLLARNRLTHTPEPLDQLQNSHDTAHEVALQQQIGELETAIASLSPKCQAVLLMHRRDRYTYQEIAAEMDISVSMVKKYLVKGLSVCQSRVSRDSHAAGPKTRKRAKRDG